MQELSFESQPLSEAVELRSVITAPRPDTVRVILDTETSTDLRVHKWHISELCSTLDEARSGSLFPLYYDNVFQFCMREFKDIASDIQLRRVSIYQKEVYFWFSDCVFEGFRQQIFERLRSLYPNSVLPISTSEEDFQWFLSSPPELVDHRGEYVAVLDKQIVANSSNMGDIIEVITKGHFSRRPVIAFVPEKGAQSFAQ